MAVMPVLTGTALAWHEQALINPLLLFVALLAALFIQIGTNLHNDAADYVNGVDTVDRLGPERVVAQGWLSASKVQQAALKSFILAFLCGIYLVWAGGLPILIIGVFSLLAAYAYSGGIHPIAYTPFGELFVLLFFGLAAVTGSYYLQSLSMTGIVILAGFIIGLPASAVLLVNNYRDLDTDSKSGRSTLVSITGRPFAKWLYAILLVLPIILAPLLIIHPARMLSWLALPMAVYLIREFIQAPIGTQLNIILARTAQYQVLLSVLVISSLLFHQHD